MDLDARVSGLLATGDAATAATEVLRALGPGVRRYLGSVLRDGDDAADAYARFEESLWRALPAFRGEAALRTWALRIAWSAARHVRAEAWNRHRTRLRTHDASVLQQPQGASAARDEDRRHKLERLRRALTDEEQSMLALRVDQELPWSEIARVLSPDGRPLDVSVLQKRFERLRARLARLARREGLLD
ncbi:RNA polymerase sigma factor [Anaeromyxobacter dehalogenans]|uniref:Sigma-24 (FecI-like) n=1 Tax=Anaeromyxobacter dehalogenans (strain 2CP-C) TaxID=290397 RepID=Q2ILN7_ANADE|nr:sigma factor [Anaeromyxobacter dehalogenans]ABC82565.1 sigma-24 (FecI-like) [Anaeromyxobacter dehalogenans 2CP-C]